MSTKYPGEKIKLHDDNIAFFRAYMYYCVAVMLQSFFFFCWHFWPNIILQKQTYIIFVFVHAMQTSVLIISHFITAIIRLLMSFLYFLYFFSDDYVPQRRRSRSGSRDSISVVLGRVGRRSSSVDYGSVRSGSREGSIDRASVERQRKLLFFQIQTILNEKNANCRVRNQDVRCL